MPPSRSCKSGDENSGGSSSDNYIDMVFRSKSGESKRSQSRSDGQRLQAPGRSVATELRINLQIEVGDRRFYLHKFPLLSTSGRLNGLVFDSRHTERDRIVLSDIPGGAPAFEFIARHFYGGQGAISPHNVAAIRCAAEYLEITSGGHSLVSMTEKYLNHEVTESWRDSITVLQSCAGLQPWAEDLEIVRRCSEAIAWKCSETRKGRDGDWWFHDVSSLSIQAFSRVIHAMTAQGYTSLVASAVAYYAERWLQLTKGSDMSTTLKLSTSPTNHSESPQSASFMAFTGFNEDIASKGARQAQHKNRAILQGIVNLLPADTPTGPTGPATPLSVKFLLKLLRIACFVNAGSVCKTDLTKRIALQLEKVALDDLLIPAAGEATYDVDVVLQIFEDYMQEQSWGQSRPQSPRSSISGESTTSRSLTSSASSSDLSDSGGSSGSSVATGSRRGRSRISSNSGSNSESSSSSSSRSSSETRSSISGSSLTSSFRSTTSDSSATLVGAFSESSSSSGRSSASSVSRDESVKLEKKKSFYVTDSSPSRKTLLPPTTANFKVAQLLETYLEEVAKDSSIGFAQFMRLAELFTEFPRDSDDSIYRALDGFLRAHPSLTDTERKSLCRLMDPGALSLAACVHAASNERLPLRVIVQLLFSEQIKLRNEMTGNDMINEKDLGSALPSFSTSTSSSSTTVSSSDTSSSTLSSGSSTSASSHSTRKSSRRSSRSISSASALNELAIDIRSPSVASSPLLGGLSVKNTLRFVLAEIESLRKSVQEMESFKSHLNVMETLQLQMEHLTAKFQEMEHLTSKFQEMSQDYVGMTQQVEELTRSSKHVKSGWSSSWKKVTKSFQSKDHIDHKFETPPLPPVKLLPTDFPDLPILRTISDTVNTKTSSSAPSKTPGRAESLPVAKAKTHSATPLLKSPRAGLSPPLPKVAPDLTKRGEAVKLGTPVQTPRDSSKTAALEIVAKDEATTPTTTTTKRGEGAKLGTPRDSFKVTGQEIVVRSETITPPKPGLFKGKEGYAISAHRSHHVEDLQRRSVRSRSTSPEYVRSRHYKDSDSVTSTSSYSKTSSGRRGHHYRHAGRNKGFLERNPSRGHEGEKGLGHGWSEDHHAGHRKHRQKEGSHNGQSQLSGDARHSSATHQSHDSGRHRYAREGSVASHHTGSEQHSGSIRSEHRRKDRHKEHRSHRSHQSFSDESTANIDFETHRRRQHRT